MNFPIYTQHAHLSADLHSLAFVAKFHVSNPPRHYDGGVVEFDILVQMHNPTGKWEWPAWKLTKTRIGEGTPNNWDDAELNDHIPFDQETLRQLEVQGNMRAVFAFDEIHIVDAASYLKGITHEAS